MLVSYAIMQCIRANNQAAEWLSFKSSNHIFGPKLFRGGGQGARKIALGEVSSDIFCIVNETKKQQNEVFFQVVLARIVPMLSIECQTNVHACIKIIKYNG